MGLKLHSENGNWWEYNSVFVVSLGNTNIKTGRPKSLNLSVSTTRMQKKKYN